MGYLSKPRGIQTEEYLVFEGIPMRYSSSGIIRKVVVSLESNQSGAWDGADVFYVTGRPLTANLVENCYVLLIR